ncbi:MAG: Asp-tRNA(Asn)/Glu-tRNA(Gln) amidotransferase subunit GatB, partial [Dehalococcoidia bacterium]|nr:Asp-tRNA(Asn)/Glu-tRNA(Gln) amidotransferase subunit GatB [Dehalococcoidia bacterium]
GYQISQYDMPFSHDGWMEIDVDGEEKRVGITRVHLEEDVARLVHVQNEAGETYSLVDVNRAGVPLMEIVGEPDLRSPEEARQYLMKLRQILQYLGVSTASMEEGQFRCDANVSIRPRGSQEFLGKVEVKNMNSFRAVYKALAYEVERQRQEVEAGGRIEQETRGWIEDEGRTVSQRTKEYAHDYRYFPEPDLPPLTIAREWVEGIRARMPELPDAKKERFIHQYGLTEYEVNLLAETQAKAAFFEECLASLAGEGETGVRQRAKAVSNWMLGDFARLLNAANMEIEDALVKPDHMVQMLDLIDSGIISGKIAKTVFEEMFQTGKLPRQIVEDAGLTQISASDELAAAVEKVLAANAKAVQDYQSGKEEALRFLIGQVMRETRGRANPDLVNQILGQKLAGGG